MFKIDENYSDYYKNEAYCKTYLYFVDNEKKIIEYCKENGIEPFEIKSAKGFEPKTFKKVQKKNIKFDFEVEEVRFSNDLDFVKPAGLSNTEFEEILTYCLELNYPGCRNGGRDAALVSNVHSLFKGAFPLLATKIFCHARHGCRSLAKGTPRTGSANSLWQGG